MPLILLKDLSSDLIPYTSVEKGILIGFISYTSIAMLLSCLLIFAIVKQQAIQIDTQYLLHICVADLLFSLFVLTFHFINLNAGGWATGGYGCLWSAMGILVTIGLSMFTISLLTAHRYLIVIHRMYLSQNQVYMSIAGIWAFLAVAASLYIAR